MTYVNRFGPIPSWIKSLEAPPGYANVFSLGIDPPAIYGTETLCGDWSGELFLLAKDFAPLAEVKRLIDNKMPAEKVYRHNDNDGRYKTGRRTNKRLMKFLFDDSSLVDGRAAESCKVVYGSACFFLKDGDTSSKLDGWKPGSAVFDSSMRIVEHAIAQMSNLKAVVCLGQESLDLMASLNKMNRQVGVSATIGRRLGQVHPFYSVPHPSRGSDESHLLAWCFVKTDAGISWIGGSPNRTTVRGC
jgi:hypothetical protein